MARQKRKARGGKPRRKTKRAAPTLHAARDAFGDGDGDQIKTPIAAAQQADDPTLLAAADDLPPPAVAFPVVGIGGSAGGLDAFLRIVKTLPKNPGLAIVIVQHLAPAHESALAQLLDNAGNLRAVEVREGMKLEVDHVFVIPPDRNMALMEDGTFTLVARPDRKTQFLPIDFFLHSLAMFARERAIGVVLSGDLSDGSFGIKEIKGAGGITFAQEPRSASRPEMPRSAIATGLVDRVMTPEQIGEELVAIAHHPLFKLGDARSAAEKAAPARPRRAGAAADEASHDLDQLTRVFVLLRNATGVDFTHYKLPTIRRRMHRRMVLHKITDLADYVKLLQDQPGELQSLYAEVLINVTRFFREPESFQALVDKALPEFLAAHGINHNARRRAAAADNSRQTVRVWVPGCSTGEEPYSVAMALLEHLDGLGMEVPLQIFATDISDAAITHARAGIYPDSIAADVSPERLRRFFNKVDGNYRISKTVRDLCVFARQDLTRDPPFSRLDLILCRNVLIYLGPVLQKRLMQVFHYALHPHGFLMLGNAETVGVHGDLFSIVDKRHRLYTKKPAGVSHFAHPHVAPSPAGSSSEHHHAKSAGPEARHAAPHEVDTAGPLPVVEARPGSHIQSEANRILLTRFTPPGVIVDADHTIVQFRGQTGAFLEPAPGEASLNLLKMAREGLLYGLRTALHDARRGESSVRKEGLRVRYGNQWREVAIEVIPLMATGEGRHFLVLFDEVPARPGVGWLSDAPSPPPVPPHGKGKRKAAARGRQVRPGEGAGAQAEKIARLEFELQSSRQYLQAIIQDLEAANEELQSANEEILSANEELQSTNEELDTAKEELQSTNEELNTVNEELSGRNEELGRVNSDLVNLLGSVQIAIVMITNDLRIRRFTPMAERLLNLIPSDIGRPISNIKPGVEVPDLEKLIAESIETATVREIAATDRRGNQFSLRVRPYKTLDNKIDGAVITLIDLGSRAQREGATGAESRGDAVTGEGSPDKAS